jgi:hypothetical protein
MKPSVAAAILGERSMRGDSALLYGSRGEVVSSGWVCDGGFVEGVGCGGEKEIARGKARFPGGLYLMGKDRFLGSKTMAYAPL